MTAYHDRLAALPIWQGQPRIEPLLGGLSNTSFRVADDGGRYVARFAGDYPFHHVVRDRELMTARAAFEAGFAPEVVYHGPGVMVSRFIEGRTYTAADVPANIGRIAGLAKAFHAEMPGRVTGPAHGFRVFDVIRDYARMLAQSKNPLTRRLPELVGITAQLEARQVALEPVFGHNDLLPANIIDDGRRLWLIDFEYAGLGTALFDLANLASNAGLSEAESEALLQAYFPEGPTDEIRMSHMGMQCASLLREALWSLVSELHLDAPGADYDAYARHNFEKFDRALAAYRAASAPA